MNGYKFGDMSLARLSTVNPRLQAVARRALELSTVDFAVVQANRSHNDQCKLYGKGRTVAQCLAKNVPAVYAAPTEAKVTWTMDSNHIGGNAIDVCPSVDGTLCWDDNGKRGLWQPIADAFKQAAKELNVPITWGGDWQKGQRDRPHFELKR